jgi:hypothetical protein
MSKFELVLLGGPNSGKTHYGGQLYGRVTQRTGTGALRLRPGGVPQDLRLFAEVLDCLDQGKAAGHTHYETWGQLLLPLEDQDGNAIDLNWPDYGGEQMKQVLERREVPMAWRDWLLSAQGWLLMIRLSQETVYPHKLEELAKHPSDHDASPQGAAGPEQDAEEALDAGPQKTDRKEPSRWDANASTVELLQVLLHAAQLGTHARLHHPRLAVLLSCYDEVEPKDGRPPRMVLAKRLPLLDAFIDSLWEPGTSSVWGLAALGKPLSKDVADDDFIGSGPRRQGWVVVPEGGERNPDLSLPLVWLLGAT